MIISNSETDTYLKCRRAHYYQYGLGLYPRKLSRAIDIGMLGHHVLEHYYRTMQEGGSRKQAFDAGMSQLIAAYDHIDPDIVGVINHRFMHYHEYYRVEAFEVIEVEKPFTIKLDDQLSLGLTPDLIVQYTKGPWKGQYAVIDHKYKFNFFTPDELSMHSQTFKYVWALRQLGYNIKRSMLNQIRYREDLKEPTKMFKRVDMVPSDELLDNIMREHRAVSSEIYETKNQPVSWYGKTALRRLGSRECSGCYFRVPCRLELLGKDISSTLSSMYAPEDPSTFYRPYGY